MIAWYFDFPVAQRFGFVLYSQVMRDYELVLVLSTKLEKAPVEKLLTKIKKDLEGLGGKVDKEEDWGKKELTFRIKKEAEGIFLFWQITVEAEKVGQFEQKLKLEEQLLRYLLVRAEQKAKQKTVRSKETKEVKKQESRKVKTAKARK